MRVKEKSRQRRQNEWRNSTNSIKKKLHKQYGHNKNHMSTDTRARKAFHHDNKW
jgi:hypothetical protein